MRRHYFTELFVRDFLFGLAAGAVAALFIFAASAFAFIFLF